MKKLFFTALAIVAFNGISMANTIDLEGTNTVAQVCCVRGASDPESGQNVTVRACVPSTGDYTIDMGAACLKAQTLANKTLKELVAP